MCMNRYRIVKKINGLGTVRYYVEQRVALFLWCELVKYSFDAPAGKKLPFETRDDAQICIDNRMRLDAEHTWVRVR